MTVKKEDSGRRSVQVEVEVAGTPEEVWQAIATGPGISSWFVPAEIEERDGTPVATKLDFGSGMVARSELTAWNPPHTWASQSPGWAPGSPPIATEWTVEAIGGGKCIVRIVHSLFATTDEWDSQLEGTESGWPAFLRTLQLYLTHFRGQRSATMKWMAPVAGTDAEAWDALTTALGMREVNVGARVAAPTDAPALRGVVEYVNACPYDALVRIDTPAPGIAALGAVNFGGQSMVALNFYVYGDESADAVARETAQWDAWFHERFPMPVKANTSRESGHESAGTPSDHMAAG